MVEEAALRNELKQLIVSTLSPRGSRCRLRSVTTSNCSVEASGSVDAPELMVAIEKEYGIKIEADDVDRTAFRSATTLARMVFSLLEQSRPGRRIGPPTVSAPEDRIVELRAAGALVAPCIQRHFPGDPIFPGVVLFGLVVSALQERLETTCG